MYAWYEMYPADMVTLPSTDAVFAGDTVSASVSVSGSTWNLEITDATQGWAFSTSVIGPAPAPAQESAEWIMEAPTPCSLFSGCSSTPTPLADFATETFSGAQAVAQGRSGPISAFSSIEETMTDVGGTTVKAQPSALSGEGTSFSVAWANPGP